MKKNKSKKKVRVLRLSIVVLLLVIVVLGVLELTHTINFFRKTSNTAQTGIQEPHLTKAAHSPAPAADNTPNNSRKTSNTPSTSLSNPANTTSHTGLFTVTINNAGLYTSYLHVSASVNDITSGTCTLNVSQSGQATQSYQDSVELQNSEYVCTPFNIPLSSFPNKNKWNVAVSVENNGSSVTAQWISNPVSLSN